MLKTDFFAARMSMVYPFLFPTAVFLVLWLIKRTVDSIILFLLEVSVASAVMTVWFEAGSRVDALGVICSLTGILSMARHAGWCRPAKIVAVGGLCVLTLIHIIAVDFMCGRLKKETEYVVDIFRTGREGAIFAPMTLRGDAPWYLFQKPYYDWFGHSLTCRLFEQAYRPDGWLVVVPEVLYDYSADRSTVLDGDAGVLVYDGLMVADDVPTTAMVADYGFGPEMVTFKATPFTARDGVERAWLYPESASYPHIYFGNPRSVSLP